MKILEEMWCGNVAPVEYDAAPMEKYKEAIRLVAHNEEKRLATMTDAQKDLLARFMDSLRDYHALSECLLFQNSFKLGGQDYDGSFGRISEYRAQSPLVGKIGGDFSVL